MANYCFIDTNLIIGYCNPSDRLNSISRDFFSELKPHYRTGKKYSIFLLYSIQKEFRFKIQKVFNDFLTLIKPFLISGSNHKRTIDEIKGYLSKRHNDNFYNYVIGLMKEHNLNIVGVSDLFKISNKFYIQSLKCFRILTESWILRPSYKDYHAVLNKSSYLNFKNKLEGFIHVEDQEHIALAAYEVDYRNTRGRESDALYTFYTDDSEWTINNLNSKININNFTIKRIIYEKLPSLGYNPLTDSFNLHRYKYIPGNL